MSEPLPTTHRLAAIALCLGVTASAVPALAAEENVNAYIAKTPITGVPAGSYNQWSEAQRATAMTRIGGFCEFLCVDSHSGSFPNREAAERAKAEAKVCLVGCIVNHLPPDYPQIEGMKQDLRTAFQQAKKLGSSTDWPLAGR